MEFVSGVGADPANNDRIFPQKQNNLTNIPCRSLLVVPLRPSCTEADLNIWVLTKSM